MAERLQFSWRNPTRWSPIRSEVPDVSSATARADASPTGVKEYCSIGEVARPACHWSRYVVLARLP